ncbi:hypothetical protein TNCV_1000181 [Trichonephila clavipes]|nr:hypothetical protein TNCV_1000181 [Trichonephila clavipes]
MNGYVNKQKLLHLEEANPQVYVKTPLHPEKLTVWCALWPVESLVSDFFKNDEGYNVTVTSDREDAMANAFWVSVRNNISKRWNTTENDVSKNQSSDESAIRIPNTSILNSNAADITEYFLDVYQTTLY